MLFAKIALIGFTKALVVGIYVAFTEWLKRRRTNRQLPK
jgi:hypothetical protein